MAGKTAKCPKCGAPVVVPLPDPVQQAPDDDVPVAKVRPPAERVSTRRTERPLADDDSYDDEEYHDRPRPSYQSQAPDLEGLRDYQIDMGLWFQDSGGRHFSAFMGPMIGFFFIMWLITMGMAILTIVFIGYFGFFLLLPQLAAGPTIVCLRQLKGQQWSFGDFFGGFKYYWTTLAIEFLAGLAQLITILPGFIIVLALGGIGQAIDPNGKTVVVPIVGILSLITIIASVAFTIYVWFRLNIFCRQIMIETNCGPIAAYKGSWRLTRGHFWGLFGSFVLMMMIVQLATFLTCGIGLLFVLPRGLLFWNAAYLRITGRTPVSPESAY